MGESNLIAEFRSAWRRFMEGLVTEEEFARFRAPVGFHRSSDGTFSIRIKFPGGRITTRQAADVAAFLQRWIPDRKTFLTPRQCLQAYGLLLEDLPQALEYLEALGLTSLRTGGAMVRNITTCEGAGLCPHQVSDPRPVVKALEEYLASSEPHYPARVKMAVSGCHRDCASAQTHALGLTGAEGPNGQLGFKVWAGGGLGRQPQLAAELEPFVPFPEAPNYLAWALKTFQEKGIPRDRMGLKGWIGREGVESFRSAMEQVIPPTGIAELGAEEAGTGPLPEAGNPEETETASLTSSVLGPHREEGMHVLRVRVVGGWMSADQWTLLAHVAGKCGGGELRLTQGQNVLLTHLRSSSAVKALELLLPAGLVESGAGSPEDPSACPGSAYCRGGAGFDAAAALRKWLSRSGRAFDSRRWTGAVRLSGCAHACGRHGTAALGFALEPARPSGHEPLSIQIWMGGGRDENGWRLARFVGTWPAEKVEDAAMEVFTRFQKESSPEESFEDYCFRVSRGEPSIASSWFASSPRKATGLARP